MKNNLINLANFLLDANKLEELCNYKDSKLSVISGLLQLDLTSDIDIPNFVKLSIREYGISTNKYIISELISVEEAKDLIKKFWIKVEEHANWQFIEQYGKAEYCRFREAYLCVFKGETENADFYMEKKCSYDNDEFIITEKNTGAVNCARALPNPNLFLNDDDILKRVNGAVPLHATALVKNKTGTFSSSNFKIFIPNIEATEYGFDVSINKKYDEENMLQYLISQVKEPINKKILAHIELQNELKINDDSSAIKKLKI
jgi:hypothetical protein